MGAARLWLTADWSRHGYSNGRGENHTECVCLCTVEPAAGRSALAHTHRRPGQGQGRAEQQHTNGGEAGGFAQGPMQAQIAESAHIPTASRDNRRPWSGKGEGGIGSWQA
eukprot:scaffold74624_cov39-Phaeocystis_antarctica.AAC.1